MLEVLDNRPALVPNERYRMKSANFNPEAAKTRCPICERLFKSAKKKAVFCDYCREHSESYKFSDWMRYS